ncbi:hypothetical protein EON80_13850 [bacterium]|nr:MAG: hypothetical protein EON80_13850 [bacterium]
MANIPPPEDFDWEAKVGVQKWSLRPKHPTLAILAGYVVSQVVGLGALAVVTAFFTNFDLNKLGDFGQWTVGLLGFSQFFLIPFGMGFVASYFWLDTDRKRSGCLPTFLNTLISCVGAAAVLQEGAVCLFMAFLFLWLAMWLGNAAGDIFWQKNPFLSVSLVPIFLLLVWTEATFPATQDFSSSTDYHSKASPTALWPYVANYPRNVQPTQGLLFALGMPAPSSCSGEAVVGGRRDCLLDGGVSVGSVVTEARKGRSLEFVFDRQPKHPEITHHFFLKRGRIDFLPDGKGGTIIRGTSWYRLNIAPVTYFSWWSESVVHSTHWRVFRWMDELARRG